MSDLVMVTAKKYYKGNTIDVAYSGSMDRDGYIYFNDETYYRCMVDGNDLQLLYPSKNIWIRTNNLSDIKVDGGNVAAIPGIMAGNGAIAPNASIEKAVQWMIDKAENQYTTYSQASGTGRGTRNLNNPAGTSFDCSSFVITAFNYAGFNINASWTGDMVDGFTEKGFAWYPMSIIPANILRRGDILVKEFNPNGHTQVYIGNNQDVNCGGTPANITTHSEDNFERGGWDGFLRFNNKKA